MRLKQIEPTMVNVGVYKFVIMPFSAFKAANISGELATVLSPVFGAFFQFVGKDKSLGDINVDDVAKTVSLNANISGDKLELLMKKLLLGGNISVEVQSDEGETDIKKLDIDLANEIFCGDVQDMFKLCFEVIKINYSGFFEKLLNRSGKAKLGGELKKRKVV